MAEITVQPFDSAAATYDDEFTNRLLGRWLRELVWEQLASIFQPGEHVLELGCGTGEDAVWLAKRGVAVTATDASPAMLRQAERKARGAGVSDAIQFRELDLASPATSEQGDNPEIWAFDGAFSNFGAVNCVEDLLPLSASLAKWIRPGGKVALVVMGPFCPWEIGWYLARGEARKAFRRFRSGIEARAGGGSGIVRVWYPSPRRLRRLFGPDFRPVKTIGIGAWLPPSYLAPVVERWPHVFKALAVLDRKLGRFFPWNWLNDHYLMGLQRQ